MIIVYHHIFPTDIGLKIAKEQESRLFSTIKDPFEYRPNMVDISCQSEMETLLKLLNDSENFDNSDYILYIHTKGASDGLPGQMNKECREYWREYMELQLIDNYKFHLDILDKDFSTSGVLMGIPFFSEYCYAGNFWWAKAKYIKTIDKNYNWDITHRGQSDKLFLMSGKNWNPYSIPWFYRHDNNPNSENNNLEPKTDFSAYIAEVIEFWYKNIKEQMKNGDITIFGLCANEKGENIDIRGNFVKKQNTKNEI